MGREQGKPGTPPWLFLQAHFSGRSLLGLGPSALGQKSEGQGFGAQQRGGEEKALQSQVPLELDWSIWVPLPDASCTKENREGL